MQFFCKLNLAEAHWVTKFFIFILKVHCGDKDLHSGVFGGSVHEAMTDLIALMGK